MSNFPVDSKIVRNPLDARDAFGLKPCSPKENRLVNPYVVVFLAMATFFFTSDFHGDCGSCTGEKGDFHDGEKTGDFSIIQSINGVLLVLITGISGHSCIIFGAIKMAEHVSGHHFLGGSR